MLWLPVALQGVGGCLHVLRGAPQQHLEVERRRDLDQDLLVLNHLPEHAVVADQRLAKLLVLPHQPHEPRWITRVRGRFADQECQIAVRQPGEPLALSIAVQHQDIASSDSMANERARFKSQR